MNRRGFLGTLLGAAVAPFLPKVKPKEPVFYGKELIPDWEPYTNTILHFDHAPGISAGDLVSIDENGNIVPCVDQMRVLGRAVGAAHKEIKVQLAAEPLGQAFKV